MALLSQNLLSFIYLYIFDKQKIPALAEILYYALMVVDSGEIVNSASKAERLADNEPKHPSNQPRQQKESEK